MRIEVCLGILITNILLLGTEGVCFVFPSGEGKNQKEQYPGAVLHRGKNYASESRPRGIREELRERTSHLYIEVNNPPGERFRRVDHIKRFEYKLLYSNMD
ncbi:hypothetical protein YC2023_002438 [Brassica napus]